MDKNGNNSARTRIDQFTYYYSDLMDEHPNWKVYTDGIIIGFEDENGNAITGFDEDLSAEDTISSNSIYEEENIGQKEATILGIKKKTITKTIYITPNNCQFDTEQEAEEYMLNATIHQFLTRNLNKYQRLDGKVQLLDIIDFVQSNKEKLLEILQRTYTIL